MVADAKLSKLGVDDIEHSLTVTQLTTIFRAPPIPMSGTVASTHRTRKHTDPSDEINGARHNSLSLPETSLEIVIKPTQRTESFSSAINLILSNVAGQSSGPTGYTLVGRDAQYRTDDWVRFIHRF